MKMHCLRHVAFENEAAIGAWAQAQGYELTCSNLYAGDTLPDTDTFDWLVVMGGPMGVHDVADYPWLLQEKLLISQAVERGKLVLGICLGAQLIADVLGAPVTRNQYKEIGWLPVRLHPAAAKSPAFAELPAEFMAFHWHGDTFACPTGGTQAAYSAGCDNQAFVFDERVVGLQFHLETTAESMENLLTHARDDLTPGPFVQSAEEMRQQSAEYLGQLQNMLKTLLHGMASLAGA